METAPADHRETLQLAWTPACAAYVSPVLVSCHALLHYSSKRILDCRSQNLSISSTILEIALATLQLLQQPDIILSPSLLTGTVHLEHLTHGTRTNCGSSFCPDLALLAFRCGSASPGPEPYTARPLFSHPFSHRPSDSDIQVFHILLLFLSDSPLND